MGRLIHFEIHVDDMERAKKFYGEVFGWTFQDWSEYAGMPYFGAVTGNADEPGINGALMQRQSTPPEKNQAMNGYAFRHFPSLESAFIIVQQKNGISAVLIPSLIRLKHIIHRTIVH